MECSTKEYQRHAAAETENNFASHKKKHNQNGKNKFPHHMQMFQHFVPDSTT